MPHSPCTDEPLPVRGRMPAPPESNRVTIRSQSDGWTYGWSLAFRPLLKSGALAAGGTPASRSTFPKSAALANAPITPT